MALAIRSTVSFLGVSAVAGMIMFGCGGGNDNNGGNSDVGGAQATGGKLAVGGTTAATVGGKTGAGGTSASATGTITTGGGTSANVGGGTAAVGGTTAAISGTSSTPGGASAGGTTSNVGGSAPVGGNTSTGTAVSCELDTADTDPLLKTDIFCLPSSTNLNTVDGNITLGGITMSATAGLMTFKGNVTTGQVNRPLSPPRSPYTDCTADAGPDVSYGLNATNPNTNKPYVGLKLTAKNNRTDGDALLVVYMPDRITVGPTTYYTLASVSVTVPKNSTITDKVLTWDDVDMYTSDGTKLCSPGGAAFDPAHILGVGVGFGAVGAVDLEVSQIVFTE